MSRIITRILDASPRKVLKKLSIEKLVKKTKFKDNVNPLQRRFEEGQLKGYNHEYSNRKHSLIESLLNEVANSDYFDDCLFLNYKYSELDERVIEYPFALSTLMNTAINKKKVQLLDVGCVLNNLLIRNYVTQFTQWVWFLNPSLEPLQYQNNFSYIVSDIRNCQLPSELKFDLVTCLSTIEHVGMDNTRYGGTGKEFQETPNNPEKFAIQATQKISQLVKVGGKLLLSVPFGPFEYLYIYGNLNDPIYYTFNGDMLLALQDSLVGFDSQIYIYKVIPGKGWVTTDAKDSNILKYAENCAGAGAVAFIEAKKIQ